MPAKWQSNLIMKERSNRLLRTLDTYLGIPLVYLLGLLRRKKEHGPSFQPDYHPKIVLIKTAGIGDTILVSAIIRELKSIFPGSSVTLICARNNAPVTDLIPELDSTFIFDLGKPFRSFAGIRKMGMFDLLIDFGPWPKINSLVSFAARADFKIGFKRENAYRHYIFDRTADHSDDVHELDNYRNLLKSVGLYTNGLTPALEASKVTLSKIENMISKEKTDVVIHPFSAGMKGAFKEWPWENWIEVSTGLINGGCRMLISGGTADMERASLLASKIRKYGGECFVLAGKYSLSEMYAILKRSELLISVNTGIMHLGAAAGTDVIALNGPVPPLRWGPLSETAINLVPKMDCAPCLSLGFEYKCNNGGCMRTITVAEVMAAAECLLGRHRDTPKVCECTSAMQPLPFSLKVPASL